MFIKLITLVQVAIYVIAMSKRKQNKKLNEDELDVLVGSVGNSRTIVLASFLFAVTVKGVLLNTARNYKVLQGTTRYFYTFKMLENTTRNYKVLLNHVQSS